MRTDLKRFLQRAALGAGAAAMLAGAAPQALAWGATGHRLIGRMALEALPAGLPAFLYTPEAVEAVGELAREPDRWKGAGKLLDATRDPAHFVDVDDAGRIEGGPALNALPPTRSEYDAALKAVNSDSFHAGYLPYSIVDGWEALERDFTLWRIETAAIAIEKDPEHKAWMQRDLKRREALTLADLGEWAHYVGDGSQPMHVSVHHNGWGDFPNPHGYTQDRIHAYFEGAFVSNNVTEAAVLTAMPAPNSCPPTTASAETAVAACTARYLAATASTTEPLYALQKAGGFTGADPRGIAFATQRIAAGAAEVRDLILSAWTASATSTAGYPPITPAQAADQAPQGDAYDRLFGED
ncbi:MAG: S1/P1 Nuclease [Caulobacteraceae bacterium]|nr:S1/P1 Nuclease [Caulobacteraceae bacterium]